MVRVLQKLSLVDHLTRAMTAKTICDSYEIAAPNVFNPVLL